MPLTDRQDFKDWLQNDTDRRRLCEQVICERCGDPIGHALDSGECMLCLAERFGTETAERWLGDVVAGLIRAAENPPLLTHILSELITLGREVIDLHMPKDAATATQ